MDLHEKIKSLRLNQSLTQKALGELLDVSTVSIGHWEAGTKNPSVSALVSLAQTFGVSTDYLLGVMTTDEEHNGLLFTKNEQILLSNYRSLDTYGKKAVDAVCEIEKSRVESERQLTKSNIIQIQHGDGKYIPRYTTPSAAGHSVPLDGDDYVMVLVNEDVPADADFAVRIQGDSMAPYIQDGDTVYVKRDCEIPVGDIGIFCVNGAMYCKQYYIDRSGSLVLVSANPDRRNTNIIIDSDSGTSVQCYGRVLLNRRIELPDYIFE